MVYQCVTPTMPHPTGTVNPGAGPSDRPHHPAIPVAGTAGAPPSSLQPEPPPPGRTLQDRLDELSMLVDDHSTGETARLIVRVDQLTAELERVTAERDAALALATHHPLTGLPNRMALRADWDDPATTITAVIMIDVNGFKAINDTYGHDVGDQVLVALAGRLSGVPDTTAYAIGGDEYALLATVPARHHDGLLSWIAGLATYPVTTTAGQIGVTVAVGATTTTGGDLDAALRRADLAMYHAKHGHRPLWWDPSLNTPPPPTVGRRSIRDSEESPRG